jgi:hypothetical protein
VGSATQGLWKFRSHLIAPGETIPEPAIRRQRYVSPHRGPGNIWGQSCSLSRYKEHGDIHPCVGSLCHLCQFLGLPSHSNTEWAQHSGHLFFHRSGTWKSEVKVSAGLRSNGGPFLPLLASGWVQQLLASLGLWPHSSSLSLCGHTASPCVCPYVQIYLSLIFSIKKIFILLLGLHFGTLDLC